MWSEEREETVAERRGTGMETHVLGPWKDRERLWLAKAQLVGKEGQELEAKCLCSSRKERLIQVDVWAGVQERQGGLREN